MLSRIDSIALNTQRLYRVRGQPALRIIAFHFPEGVLIKVAIELFEELELEPDVPKLYPRSKSGFQACQKELFGRPKVSD